MERRNGSGKQGRAVSVEEEWVALAMEIVDRAGVECGGVGLPTEEVKVRKVVLEKVAADEVATAEAAAVEVVSIPSEVNELISLENLVYTISLKTNTFDLYEVGHELVTCDSCSDTTVEIPFSHQLKLHGPQGVVVQIPALFDGAAMVPAICISLFNLVKHCLGSWQPSCKLLRMANGVIVPLQACWVGAMQLKGMKVEGSFEVFDSGGSWAFLLGKPLLRQFKAKHDFELDMVKIMVSDGSVTVLQNELGVPRAFEMGVAGVNIMLDIRQRNELSMDVPAADCSPMGPPAEAQPVYITIVSGPDDLVLMCSTEPFKDVRVARIREEVTIGPDVMDAQCEEALQLIGPYADCFALGINEVNAIQGAIHKLNILVGTTFHMKILPRSYNPDQWAFVEAKLDEMLEAGVVHPIHP